MFQLIWIVFAGLIIGALARLFLRGRQHVPIWFTIFAGIVGAAVGNWLASQLSVRHTSGIDWIRHALQIGAAMVLIGTLGPLWAARSGRSPTRRY